MAVEASSAFLSTLLNSPETFLQPSVPLYTDTLAYLKHALDPIAADVSSLQNQRRKDARKKRKRGSRAPEEDVLRFKQIHTQRFTIEQVWEQSKRVIDAVAGEVERDLEDAQELNGELLNESEDEDGSSLGEEGVDYEIEGIDVDGEEDDMSEEDLDQIPDGDEDLAMEDEGLDSESEILGNDEPPSEFVSDKFGLNDGFFSIDDFNRQSEFLEQQDVRGEDDGAASDEEDVDWDADPVAQSIGGAKSGQNGAELEEEDDEDGPTFGDPDAMSGDEDGDEILGGEMNDLGDMANTNNVMYKDFFAPPAQKKRKNKKGRPNPHNFPEKGANGTNKDNEGEEEEMSRTMAAVHRDLFEDSESSASDTEQAPMDPSDPRSRRSTHEKRRAALADEIRKLEAANVAKRSWTLSGEARAADRPINSLLEEDLEFERAGKPVPVITAEVSESIEELIKRRILAHDFQDIARRRPDDLITGKDARRGAREDFVLDDSKSKKGLAEEYEEEHLRRTDPNYTSATDAKTQKEEAEISGLWKKVCSDLDSLSSWNFRPKQPLPQLDIRVDAPAITLEDARPAAGGEVAGASQLAPQEVYRAGDAAKDVKGEVVGKSGLSAARDEVNREDTKRRRRREKERARKAGGNIAPGEVGNVNGNGKGKVSRKDEKKNVISDLKKGGVGVIGRKGDVTDLSGREVKRDAVGAGGGAGRFKL